MFQLIQNGGSVSLTADGSRAVLEGLGAAVQLQDGTRLDLTLASLEETGAVFSEPQGRATVRLTLSSAGSAGVLNVRAEAANRELFRDLVSFAPVAGIVLRVGGAPGLTSLLANYQHKDWWTRPHVDPNLAALPPRTLSLLWRTGDGAYTHLLPATGDDVRADLAGSPAGGFDVRISAYQGGFSTIDTVAFAISCGRDPYALSETTAKAALTALAALAPPRAGKSYPEPFEYLGWCSWDAFYKQVNAEGLLTKTAELSAAGLPVRWVMIDDGWSETTEDKRLTTYDADPGKFPDGLAPVAREMKERHGVRWVGVWHTIAGYWGGIDPEGELFARNRHSLFETNGGAWVPAPEPAKAFGFWNDWHGYLKKQGIDFVKVDSQSAVLNFFRDHAPVGRAAKAAHSALEASVALHFGGTIINCMGMSSENIWHRPMSAVSRNSDDFVPEEATGFREHALQNAYNSFFHGAFYWGDWDMFWSSNHDAVQNMTLRAISGGPVYVSDKIGGTDAKHIWPLVFRDGRIIRCDRPGLPTEDCLTLDPVSAAVPLKLWNTAGTAGVVAAFGLSEAAAEGTVGPSDVPGLAGGTFVAYEFFSGKAVTLAAEDRLPLALADGQTAMYTFAPAGAGAVTPIGLTNKLVPTAAIERIVDAGARTTVILREGGRFGFAADAPVRALVNGRPAEPADRDGWFEIDCAEVAGAIVIDIDVGAGNDR